MTVLLALLALQDANTLTPDEASKGWTLLFDGHSTQGWRAYRGEGMRPGWVVKDGTLVIENPEDAGDIVTNEAFRWFELKIEFKMEPGQNSGIMFHVTEDAEASWHSGPEIQIYDHKPEPGLETTGFLYQLYKPDFDASKPAGEWNQLRLHVAANGSFTELNGRRLYDFNIQSEDFKVLVSKSKFSKHAGFGKAGKGHIAIQGDHGRVAFRNIKILPIKAEIDVR